MHEITVILISIEHERSLHQHVNGLKCTNIDMGAHREDYELLVHFTEFDRVRLSLLLLLF